jgi:hypothetical protein
MLLFAVPLVWLAVATFVVLLCRAAAHGDAAVLADTKRASAGTAHGTRHLSGRTRTSWRPSPLRSAARAGDGKRRSAAWESDLLGHRGGE